MEGDVASMMPPVMHGLMKPLMCHMIGRNLTRGLASPKAMIEAA